MDVAYWDEKAEVYEDEIFNVWRRDFDGVLKSFFEHGNFRTQTVMDCGCGIGHGIVELSKHFRSVCAVDISQECLAVAQERYGTLTNVEFHERDLLNPRLNLPKVECAVSINSVITPSLSVRLKMLKCIRAHLKPDGRMVLVVPSLESYYYAAYKLTEWKLREGVRVNLRCRQETVTKDHGVVPIDGVLTKHYLQEELISFLRLVGFTIEEIKKVRYGWETEYENPPDWMQAPYPWDWMCVARKAGRMKEEG